MKIPDLIEKVKTGVVSITFYNGDNMISSGSGFLCKNRIITNNHVICDPEGNVLSDTIGVKIRFAGDEVNKYVYEDTFAEFHKALEVGATEASFDYAVFNLDTIEYNDRYQFVLGSHDDVKVGEKVLMMGFPFSLPNLTSHVGYISSIYKSGDVDVLQLDASVNAGNSGGPLIDLESLKVVGIVTRSNKGLERQFDELLRSFSNNIRVLEEAERNGSIAMVGINPIEFFKVTQSQMILVSKNIKRSANTGIGYAFSCEKLSSEKFYSDSHE